MTRRRTLAAVAAAFAAIAAAPAVADAAVTSPGVPADAASFAQQRVEPILVVPVRFAGEPTKSTPLTVPEMQANMVEFRDYFLRSSNGNVDYKPQVANWVTIPRSAAVGGKADGSESLENTLCYAWNAGEKGFDWSTLQTPTLQALGTQQPGIDQTQFKRFIFVTPNPYRGDVDGKPTFDNSCPAGLGYYNPWLYERNIGASFHEWMHAIGLNHGGGVKCTERDVAVPAGTNCSFVGTVDATDAQNTVAGGESFAMNGTHRLATGMLPTDNVIQADTSVARDYTITNIEESVPVGTKQILKVPRGVTTGGSTSTQLPYYYIDLQRPKTGFASVAGSSDSALRGVSIRRGPQIQTGERPSDQPRVVNPTPGRGTGDYTWNARSRFTSTDGRGFNRLDPDLTLKVGQSIWDPEADLTITTKSITATTATVEVRKGKPTQVGAQVSLSGGVLKAEQTSSNRANLVVSKDAAADKFYVSDYGSAIRATSPCVVVNVQTASCPATGVTGLELRGGSGDDTFAIGDSAGTLPAKLFGNAGDDSLEGGAGDDTLDGGIGADAMDGGKGTDTVTYATRTAPVFAARALEDSAWDRVADRGRGELNENDGISRETENAIAPTAIAVPKVTIGSPQGTAYVKEPTGAMTFTVDNQSGRTLRFECTFFGINKADWKPCSPGQEFRDDLSPRVAEGRHVFDFGVRSIDTSSNATLAREYRQGQLIYDGDAPDTNVTSEPSAPLLSGDTARFEFTSPNLPAEPDCSDWHAQTGETCVSFEASIDGKPWSKVSSPWTTAPMTGGSHTIAIRARDLAGNVDPTPYEDTFYVRPTVAITSGPANDAWPSAAQLPATYGFSSPNTPDASYRCSINGSTFATCPNPYAIPASTPDGVVRVGVVAVAGILQSAPVYRNVGIDRVAPAQPSITSGPANGSTVTTNSVTFTFSTETAATGTAPVHAEYLLDTGTWTKAGTGDLQANGLSDGQHTFSVRAVDEAGNASAAVTRTFTVNAGVAAGVVSIGTPAPFSGTVNLTNTPSTALDWIHWRGTAASNYDRSGNAQRIGSWTKIGTASVTTRPSPGATFAGAASGPNNLGVTTGIAAGQGWRFTVSNLPSDSVTLRLYVGVFGGTSVPTGTQIEGQLKATLTGKASVTSQKVSTTTGTSTTTVDRVITVKFRRVNTSDTLTLEWTKTGNSNQGGSTVLYAASLH